MSTLKMCHTFRELEVLHGEPIDFAWINFPGATALDILHKFQADLQGKHITLENFSDRIIFMTMFNDIELEEKDNEDSCALTSRKIKEYASNFNEGHRAFLGPGEESKWYQGYATNHGGKWDLRATQMVEDFENSGHPVFQGIRPLGRGTLKKKNYRDTIHFKGKYRNVDLLYRTVHSANQLCICGAVTKWCGPNSGEANRSRPEGARKMSPEIQIKQEDLKSLVDIPRPPHAPGNRMLQNLKDFNSMLFMSKIEKGNYHFTTTLDVDGWRKRTSMCKEYTAPRNREDSKPYASIDAEKTGPVLNIEIATIIDVPGIEVQVPSLSAPGYSVWILISPGHERFVNEIHRPNSDIVNYSSSLRAKEDNLNNVCSESSKPAVVNQEQGSQDSNNVKTKVEPSSVHREPVASTIRVAPASSKSSSDGSGGISNPTSTHPKSKSIYIKKEITKRAHNLD